MAGLIGLDSTGSGFDPGLQDPPITFGVWGDSGEADGVIGSSNTGVGVFGRSVGAGAPAVRAASENGTGVQATSASGTALHARRDPGGGATVTEAFLATPSLAADFRGDVTATGELRVGGRLGAGSLNVDPKGPGGIVVGDPNTGTGGFTSLLLDISDAKAGFARIQAIKSSGSAFGDTAVNPHGGNVGIGTTAPKATLHIAGDIVAGSDVNGQKFIFHTRTNGGGDFLHITGDDASGNWQWNKGITFVRATGTVGIRGQLDAGGGLTATGVTAVKVNGTAVGVEAEGGIAAVHGIGSATGFAGLFRGNVRVTGELRKGSGQFEIDHPLDPANKFLYHSSIECDEMKNLYDGVAELDTDGRAEVVLPDWFEALNETFRYQLTPIGAAAPDLHIADELRDGRFTIGGGQPNMKVCWLVSGVRHDAYAQAHPLRVEVPKSSEEAGLFLHAEEHDQPAERSMDTLFTAPANGAGHG